MGLYALHESIEYVEPISHLLHSHHPSHRPTSLPSNLKGEKKNPHEICDSTIHQLSTCLSLSLH